MARTPATDLLSKRNALLSSPFFQSMSPAEIDDILQFATERRYPRGTTIFSQGDPGSSMMAVLAGRIRIGSVSPDGREVTLNFIDPGEIFGELALLDGKPRSNDATAAEDTTLMVVERRDFMPFLMSHQALVERMFSVLCDRVRQTSLALESLALLDLPGRLARLLITLGEEEGRPDPAGGVRIMQKLSQHHLSTLVASSRETVNKQLSAWDAAGLIDRREGYVVLLNQPALQALYKGLGCGS